MKILLTMNLPYFPAVGGANKANRSLAEEFVRRGHTVQVVVPALGTPSQLTHAQFLEALAAEGIQVTSQAGVDVFQLKGVEVHAVAEAMHLSPHLTDQLRAFKPDWALVSSEDPSQRLLEIALQSCPERVAYLVHTAVFLPFGPQSFFPSARRAKLFGQIRVMVAVSAFVRDYIRQWSGLDSTVIYMPVYGPGPFPQLGNFENEFVTLVNPCAIKGISIFEGLAQALPEIQFAAVPTWGTTPADRARLERRPNVHLLEPCADFDRILARTRVTLVPSLSIENFSLTAVESMLRGIPVLGSRVGGIPEAKLGTDFLLPVRPIERFTDQLDENHLPIPLVPEQDLQPWREALAQLLSERTIYAHHSRAARAAAEQFVSGLSLTPLEELLLRLSTETRSSPAVVQAQAGVTEPTPEAESSLGRAANLTPEQRALLMLKLRKKSAGAAKVEDYAARIPVVAREVGASGHSAFPLSFAQQRLWFLDQINPGSPVYNLFDVFRFSGPLNVTALEQSFNELVRRHESLRTTFPTAPGRGHPVQRITARLDLPLNVIDLTDLPAADREGKMQSVIAAESHRPFDLVRGPLIRVHLLRLAENEHVLLLTLHHIISDAWSTGILLGELATLYHAFTTGMASPLPELSLHYADYAAWQQNELQSAARQQDLSYWKRQLADAPPQLELPTDSPRPPLQTFPGATQRFTLPAAVYAWLMQLSQREGATLFMTCLAAFQAFLYRYTRQTDIVVGTPITGRTHAETEKLIGLFVNTLALRTPVSGELSFKELVKRVREVALEAYAHQETPFEKIVEALQLERDLSRSPLFQVVFLLNKASALPAFSGLTAQRVLLENQTVKFDLVLALVEGEQGLSGELRYNVDLFNSATIARMVTHFQTFLAAAAANPEQRLSELTLLSEAELRQMLVEWNAPPPDSPPALCFPELFERQAEQTPDAIAVIFDDVGAKHYSPRSEAEWDSMEMVSGGMAANASPLQVTYRVLNDRANQLAHYLRTLGVGPEVRVGVCVERSLEMVIGLLGILKAGGAYVPLDPSYPAERLAYILADARIEVLVTQARGLGARDWGLGGDVSIIYLDTQWETIIDPQSPIPNPQPPAPENTAYLIYTSGSTGQPKGVLVPHRGLGNLAAAQIRAFGVQADSRVLQFASFSFDASVSEVAMALLAGATLCLTPAESLLPGPELIGVLQAQAITTVTFPPSLLSALPAEELPWLETIVTAGEACSAEIAARWSQGHRFINAYGPTEATVCATIAEQIKAGETPSIGRPMAHTQVYLLDQHLRPVPLGVPGELYIGGIGLAHGYLNRPDLTAERFVPNPFAGEDEGRRTKDEGENIRPSPFVLRLYKTGDLARYLPNGTIEFLGRLDHQVKVRGYRIELGEIESALHSYPGIRDVVVLARAESGSQRLVAYVVTNDDGRQKTEDGGRTTDDGRRTNLEPWALDLGPSSLDLRPPSTVLSLSDLRTFLTRRLPEYMLPAAFVFLDALPLSPNGKVDRKALSAVEGPGPRSRPEMDKAYVAPRTPLEMLLADLWQTVLGLEHLGVEDDFFELGGDSIRAAILINQLQARLGQYVYVVALFDAPTIAALAVYLTAHYPESVARIKGDQLPEPKVPVVERVDAEKVARLRRVIPALTPRLGGPTEKNPPAIFVLSPPRSGSTLLRVMLAGHPHLFAPPELELLSFNTLAERSAALTGRYSFWLEGTLRALMEIHPGQADEARRIMTECESQQLTTQAFYGRLQAWLGEKQLVDKTPAYALDLEILKRAESDFEQTRYIHLLRHPYGMIHSFEEAKLDQVFFRYAHNFSPRQLAELIWLISQQNILEFLRGIPRERQYRLRFENLVAEPERELEALCGFLGLAFEPEMARPYHAKDRKMTDGIHPLSKMLGDVKFHTHQSVDSTAAQRWAQAYPDDFLGDETWAVAETLGYARLASSRKGDRPVAPTSAENAAERASHLTREQRALLMLRLRKDAAGPGESQSTLSPIPVVARTNDLPLSFAQQRLWVLDQLEPGNPAYHMPKALRLRGALNAAALERSFNALLQRHEILRTIFPAREGQPRQVILPELRLTLGVTDLSGQPNPEREAEARRLGIEEILRPFDLAHGPLIRIQLLRLAEAEHILLVSLHHIISDGWSMGIFWRELSAFYNAFSVGHSVLSEVEGLPELPLHYADFAHWQRHDLQGQMFEKQLAYWKQQLAEAPAMLELPTAHSRPAVQTFRGGKESLALSPTLSQALINLSRREGVTLFMTLFAAFQALLARYSGQADVVVGTPIAGRTRAEMEAVIGCFLNTLALRTDLTGNPSFRDVLSRVREVALGAYAHQDLPFEHLLEELHPVRDLSRTPIFQVLFNMWRFDSQPINLTGLQVEMVNFREEGEAKFDLTLYADELPDKIRFSLVYNADLFDEPQMAQFLNHLHALLAAVTADPDLRLADLPLTPPSARTAPVPVADLIPSLEGCVDFAVNEIEQTIPARFEAQVQRAPERLAVKTTKYSLSYAELNAAANNVAHAILTRRGDIEERTALLFDHDAPMVIGLLGVLKAGKTYVPLDPTYPPERLTYMVQDSQASLILTDEDHLPLATTLAPAGVEILLLDEGRKTNDEGSSPFILGPSSLVLRPSSVSFSPDRLAYLLYTSGSTGQPKGVMQNHRNVLHHIRAYTNNLHLSAADRLTLFSSYSFDAAVMDIFGALLNGATLYPYPIKVAGMEGLADWLLAHDITIYHSTPTVFRYFVETLDGLTKDEGRKTNVIDPPSSVFRPSSFVLPCLRLLVLGGEEAQRRDAEAFQRHFGPACRLINGLGPTESTVSLQYVIDHETRLERPSVPVGYPVDQTEVRLLTEVGEQAAIYGLGEIALRSPHLAVGYWNQPELTEERFIKDQGPRAKAQGSRPLALGPWPLALYRTGDLGRYLPDGSLEFVGRRDFQVKVRGYRVEIGEIETRLLRLPGVKAAVVVAQATPRGESQLVAYVVAAPGAVLVADELRRKLSEHLPDYMVPVACLLLEALPLTPTGKVDRRSLPKLELSEGTEHRAPRNPVEDLLAGIYAELLGLERVGVEADFFVLGGHSLLATRALSRIRALLGVELPLRALFESPTIAGLAEHLARAQATEADVIIPPLKPVNRAVGAMGPSPLPLSFAQQRLWFLDQLEPGNPSYHLLSALRLTGSLDVEKLEQAFDRVIQRHESLRTTFPILDGQPMQRINPAFNVAIPIMDLPNLSETEQAVTVERLIREELHRPFDLAEGPLLHVRLLRLSESEHVLILVFHHIISDAWSIGLFIREVSEFYAEADKQKPELSIHYADYAVWEREWLQGEALERQLNYWKQQLAGAPPLLKLPTDYPRPPFQSSRGARQALTISPELTAQLKTLGRQTGATLYMTLLAAFQTLLARYSGQTDIVIGSSIASRQQAEMESLIGCFVNTLTLRGDLSENPTFRELLSRTRETALGAFAHQALPFEQLVEALQLGRNLSQNPVFQVMFVLQNAPRFAISLPGLTLQPIGIETGTAQFDLTLYLWETTTGMGGGIEYSTDLFEAATVSRLVEHFQLLLEAVVAHPDLPLWNVPLLTETERRQLLAEWNVTRAEYPRGLCIHQLFEAQARRTPDATAICRLSPTGEIKLSYRELNEKANQLAHYLRQMGIGPESFVGLCVERSLEMAIGLLGILKAGGAYVPLDPTYPAERLAFMIEDSDVRIVLTKSRWLDEVRGAGEDDGRRKTEDGSQITSHESRITNHLISICLDTDWPSISQSSISNPQSPISSLSPAYIIYTSGSTGTPKGVVIPHSGLVNHSHAIRENYALQPSDRVLQFASISFDVAAEEFYPTWLSGAAVVFRPDQLGSFEEFQAFVAQAGVTVLNLPTPFWQEWVVEILRQPRAALSESLRLVIIGNEKGLPERVESWQALTGGRIRLKNAYGPTEATITTTVYDPPDVTPGAMTVPIGRPLPNVEVYLLDPHLQPVPIGMPGELYVGGAGLARGYLNRPELTAEKFVPNPFAGTDDERRRTEDEGDDVRPSSFVLRLYKTGDLARYLPDGNIEFLGRVDHQVKVRGFRIELGEIEIALGQHPAVRQAVVAAREDVPGEVYLAAYLVADQAPASVSELREMLKSRLPDYMIPSAFVWLTALPLLPNGKLDRGSLPAPDDALLESSVEFVAPRTQAESVLAGIWSEVLRRERIGIHDNFFDLGGHSLLATQVISRVREAFQIELPLRTLFESSTLEDLAQSIEAILGAGTGLIAPPLRPVAREVGASGHSPLPLSFAQQRLWFLDQFEPNSSVYNIPTAFRLTGPLDVSALERAFNALLERHEILRTTFAVEDDLPVQVIAPVAWRSLRVEDLSALPPAEREAEARRWMKEDALQPFSLTRGPLLRLTLLCLEPEVYAFLFNIHHSITDGWSLDIFWQELTTFYEAFINDQPVTLPALPIQYADFAAWQRNWLQGEVLETHLAYWKRHLADAPPVLELPTDRPRPATQTFHGARHPVALSLAISEALKALSDREGATLFMTLVAAFQTLLARYTRQEDIVVGTPIAGRNRAEIEELIGFFVNTLVLRTDLSGNPTFPALLQRVREVALEAYTHQDVPFEKLVEELQPERKLSHSPLFQALFVLQNESGGDWKFSNLSLTPWGVKRETVMFDLTLDLTYTPEGLRGQFGYNTDLFEPATIARMAEHFQVLLEGIAAQPDRPLADLPLLTEAETQKLLGEWNATQVAYPEVQCLHALFEAQAERTPEAMAMVYEDGVGAKQSRSAATPSTLRMTYRELNTRANQLAYYLQTLGVGPEVTVGLYLERSLDFIVALLGVLKAGGAYVPLDTSYPEERLAYMIEDARIKVLVTQDRLLKTPKFQIPNPKFLTTISMDTEWETINHQSAIHNPQSSLSPSNLAYLIYTSGSTGQPKGVAVEHRQIFNYLQSILERLDLPPGASYATVSTFAADLGNTVVFPSLVTGGCLHILSQERAADPEALADYFSRHPIDCLKIVPSHLGALLNASRPEQVLPRRRLVLGGEASRSEWVAELHALAPNCAILNHYGPTETTIGVLTHDVQPDSLLSAPPILPLGRPLNNTQIYILDAHLQPVPIGVPGELYIGGEGLTRGYLNRPDLTAERFVPNPFVGTADERRRTKDEGTTTRNEGEDVRLSSFVLRLYKTGDLARYLPNGNIEFLGRVDHQVKIRGFRIELPEIEARLRQHSEVQEAVVMKREDTPGDPRLVAYVVPVPERVPAVNGRRRYRLPNNLGVVQLNKNETDYIYREIFELQAYLRHGITLRDGDCIFDVGANIGLFTLFMHQMCRSPRVYAFEPNPTVAQILRANAALHAPGTKVFECGVSSENKTAEFTFFSGFSLLSGFYADAATEKQVVKNFMHNQQQQGAEAMRELVEEADELLEERFAVNTFTTQLKTLSTLIRELELEQIDLLKINVEKSEFDVLLGLEAEDWSKIAQIVLEVDLREHLDAIVNLLEGQGYELCVEQDVLLQNTQLCYLYAIRPSAERQLIQEQALGEQVRPIPLLPEPFLTSGALRSFLSPQVPDYMVPSAFVLLEALPLTANGKLDRRALSAVEGSSHYREGRQTAFAPPRTPVEEKVAEIWRELLRVERIGLHDNFFELGGHSLLATQAIARVRKAFQVELPVRSLFEAPTLAALAERIMQTELEQADSEMLARMLAELGMVS